MKQLSFPETTTKAEIFNWGMKPGKGLQNIPS